MKNTEHRIKKLEEKSVGGKRLVYPFGYFYGEPNCEPYWTDEPVKRNMADFYDDIKNENKDKQ